MYIVTYSLDPIAYILNTEAYGRGATAPKNDAKVSSSSILCKFLLR